MLQALLQILQIRLNGLPTCKFCLYILRLLLIGQGEESANWEATRVQSPSSGQTDQLSYAKTNELFPKGWTGQTVYFVMIY